MTVWYFLSENILMYLKTIFHRKFCYPLKLVKFHPGFNMNYVFDDSIVTNYSFTRWPTETFYKSLELYHIIMGYKSYIQINNEGKFSESNSFLLQLFYT